MKFAFIYKGDPSLATPKFTYADEGDTTVFIRVSNVKQACRAASALVLEGYNLFEMCGAFSEEDTNEVAKVLNDKASIGYVVRNTEQQIIFEKLF